MRSKFFDFAHVLIGKPVPTFPGHALAQLESPNSMQMCQVFVVGTNFLILRRESSRRQWCTERFGPSLRSVRDAELDQTVSALEWRCPRREPRNNLASQAVV